MEIRLDSHKGAGYIKNMELIAYHDVESPNLFQMALHRTQSGKYYLYGATFGGLGIHIFDVTDPANPRFIKRVYPYDPKEYPKTSTIKIQVCENLLMLSVTCGGGAWFSKRKLDGSDEYEAGLLIYSIAEDPENPELLSFWNCGVPNSTGVHRFMYNGGRYVHLSAEQKGFYGLVYRIIDVEDPRNPKDVSTFFLPEQYYFGSLDPELTSYNPSAPHFPGFMDKIHLHGPPYVRDGLAYCGYNGAGLCIVDVHDVTAPRLVGRLGMHPPFASGYAGARCHTALPLTGRDLVVVTNEGERWGVMFDEKLGEDGAQAYNSICMIDVKNPAKPVLISIFPYPEVPEEFPYKNFNYCGLKNPGAFGPHNLHEPMSNKPYLEDNPNRVYNCYFHAGMRVYDVSDPYYIKELAYFIPPPPNYRRFQAWPGPLLGTAEDCVVDDRGYIYMGTLEDGLFILKCLV